MQHIDSVSARLRNNTPTELSPEPKHTRKSRGQSVVEMALVLPLLIALLSVVIEAGLAINAWIRVNTAARDATRFVLDAGRPSDTASLVLTKLKGIDFGASKEMTGSQNLDVFVITGTTNLSGQIPASAPNWVWRHVYDGDAGGGSPTLSPATVSQRLRAQYPSAAGNLPFVIVEVNFRYTPLLATIIPAGAKMPMTSYAIIQKY